MRRLIIFSLLGFSIPVSAALPPRVVSSGINVPSSPPATAIGFTSAFPGLTFPEPTCLVSPPGDSQRLFVGTKGGTLHLIPDVTSAAPTSSVFLTLPVNTGSESGLLGVAFHPDYASNGFFYVFYSTNSGGLKQRVSRFSVDPNNTAIALTNSELILIDQADEAGNHNGGDIRFGPDGYLYISLGDEGGGNDQYNNSQLINRDLFAGILRIDVDKKTGNVEPTNHNSIPKDSGLARFSIPLDNPFVHTSVGGSWDGTFNGSAISDLNLVRREFYATGLRNPWRMSFDSVTGKLWCADVGQGAREEINIIENGGNYGWAFYEGNINGPKVGQAPANFDTLYHTRPVYDYSRGSGNLQGNCVTGGLVYRGTRLGALVGKYIFADYVSGNVWSLQEDGSPSSVQRIAGEGGIVAFGTDPSNQDVLICDHGGNGYGSSILRLVSNTSSSAFPQTLTNTGLFQDVADLSPTTGLIPYDVNLPFWSDHAIKRRWFIVPDGVSKFTWSKENPWTLPTGTIWVKHFDMEMQRGNPQSKKRIETRLFVKNETGAYGVSYRWNENGTEATLVEDGGENFTLNITENDVPVPQTWRIPSRAECMICHNPQAGYALSFQTRQLNRLSELTGENQVTELHEAGYFLNDPGSPNLSPRHISPDEEQYSVEARARSYLAVNCAYCHQDGGSAAANWDGRALLTLEQTGLVNGAVNNNGGDAANKLLVRGQPEHSVILSRTAATNGFTRMPPIGSNVIDIKSVELLTDWISGELVNRQTYAEWRTEKFDSATSPEGDLNEDPDSDGMTNEAEFIAGTSPLNGSDLFQAKLGASDGMMNLSFEMPNNRSYQIHTSEDLQTWSPWDVSLNQGLPVIGGTVEIDAPVSDEKRFFKVVITPH